MSKQQAKIELDPDAPGLDEMTRKRRRALVSLRKMTPEELFRLAIRAGIYTKKGNLEKPYRKDAKPSSSRPAD